MTLRDILVQLGFLMVMLGAMVAAWAVFTGQLRRTAAEPDEDTAPSTPDEARAPVGATASARPSARAGRRTREATARPPRPRPRKRQAPS